VLHPALSFNYRSCQSVSSTEGETQPVDAGSSQGQYRDSVLLPCTDFPIKLTGQKLLDRELEIQRVRKSLA
jgi:hypothetical protein